MGGWRQPLTDVVDQFGQVDGLQIRPAQVAAAHEGQVAICRVKGLLDRLLIAALIEARSCERLWLLEQAGPAQAELGSAGWLAFLLELERCEAGHAVAYRSLAEERFGAQAEARLEWWLDREAEVIQTLPWRSAVH